ncbi:MAG: hypothetical protein JWL83_30 [Actinomycetia bacterium]|nr:hypothetical protein [Actinomycetes bacterium]
MLTLAVIVVAAGALGGCSGSAKHAASTSSAAGATTTSAPTSQARAADTAVARRTVLAKGDLPPGWHAIAGEPDSSGVAALQRRCPPLARARRHIEALEGGALPQASSAFVNGNRGLPLVRARVYVLANAGLATKTFKVLAGAAYARCVALVFTGTAARPNASVTYGTPSVSTIAVPLQNGATGYRLSVPTTSNGASFTTHLDLVTLRRGRVVHLVLFEDAELLPLPAPTRDAILRAVLQRDRQAGVN